MSPPRSHDPEMSLVRKNRGVRKMYSLPCRCEHRDETIRPVVGAAVVAVQSAAKIDAAHAKTAHMNGSLSHSSKQNIGLDTAERTCH